jgi:hypothetical protein
MRTHNQQAVVVVPAVATSSHPPPQPPPPPSPPPQIKKIRIPRIKKGKNAGEVRPLERTINAFRTHL